MALTTYPLNNVDFSAEDAELFHCTRSSGIYAGDDFRISVTGADRSISVGPGIGWIRNSRFSGKVVAQKESVTLDMGVPDAVYSRIDAVVIQFSAAANRTTLVVKQGVAASNPVAPALVQTESMYELHLCHVRRPAGSAVITAADVTDLRLSQTYCGLMADAVANIDTSAIHAQVMDLIASLKKEIQAAQDGSFAPAGFGLGTTCTFVSSPDLATACGFYMAPAPSEIASAGNMRGVVLASSATYLTQIWSVNGSLIKRELANGVFEGYEWLNPPMNTGVEYRTTERWNGKAVYAKRIYWGLATDSKGVPHGVEATNIIRFTGTVDGLPMPLEWEPLVAKIVVAGNNIYLVESGFDGLPVFVTLWYTKD